MNLEQLQSFRVFAEHLNFTRAAEICHLSQPALHVQIRKLSEGLGVPLYRKRGRNLELTAEGRRLAAFARELSERIEGFERALRGEEDRPPRLMAGQGAFLYLLGAGIRAYRAGTGRRLLLTSGNAEQTVAALYDGSAHLGVAALDTVPEELTANPLTTVGAAVVMPVDHSLTERARVRPVDLEGSSLIVPPPDRMHRRAINRLLDEAGVRWRAEVEVNGWELMIHFVSLGFGLAIVNDCCRLPPGLTARRLEGLSPIRYFLLRRAEPPRARAVAELETYLDNDARAWQGDPTSARYLASHAIPEQST